jgi:hypothetical protein
MAVLFLETVQNGPNDRRERVPIPPRIRRKGRPQKLEEPFPDDLLQQHILIRIVNVERSPVDVGAVGNILDADGRKPFLRMTAMNPSLSTWRVRPILLSPRFLSAFMALLLSGTKLNNFVHLFNIQHAA